jgi:hypothetical protein
MRGIVQQQAQLLGGLLQVGGFIKNDKKGELWWLV